MIKFFRKIRLKLLTENLPAGQASKFSKYLLYAIGEIVLVMIGILLALQVNDWNDEQKTNKNQATYLLLLKEEASKNILEVKRCITEIKADMEGQIQIMSLEKENIDTLSERYLAKLFQKVLIRSTIVKYENSVLSEIKSTGQLKNIKNDTIRKYLKEIETIVDVVKRSENEKNEELIKVNNIITKNGHRWRIYLADNDLYDKTTFREDFNNINLLTNQEFVNQVTVFWGSCYAHTTRHYPKLEEHLETLVTLIDKELEK